MISLLSPRHPLSLLAAATLAVAGLSGQPATPQATTPAPAPGSTDTSEVGARFANGIAAIVEDRIITVGDIRRRIEPLLPQIRAQSRSATEFRENIEQVEDDIIQNLVDEVLIVKDFYSDEKRKGGIPASYIDETIDERIMTEFEGDRSKFLAYLRAIGKTQKEYRRIVEDETIVGYMESEMRKSTTIVSPAKIENFYTENRDRFYQGDSVHLRLIHLTKIADENDSILEQTADTVMKQLREGAAFADMAKEYSQDPSKKQGGDWGWWAPSDLREELSTAAFALEKGEFSEPIKLDNEIYILYAEDRRVAGIQPIEEVREQIERILVSQMAREAQDRWLERLRRSGYVRYFN
ncbi:MAG: peptidylprolyl isomerase [Opitutaceae bacterium]